MVLTRFSIHYFIYTMDSFSQRISTYSEHTTFKSNTQVGKEKSYLNPRTRVILTYEHFLQLATEEKQKESLKGD